MACHPGLCSLVRDQAESAPQILFCDPCTLGHFPESCSAYGTSSRCISGKAEPEAGAGDEEDKPVPPGPQVQREVVSLGLQFEERFSSGSQRHGVPCLIDEGFATLFPV